MAARRAWGRAVEDTVGDLRSRGDQHRALEHVTAGGAVVWAPNGRARDKWIAGLGVAAPHVVKQVPLEERMPVRDALEGVELRHGGRAACDLLASSRLPST